MQTTNWDRQEVMKERVELLGVEIDNVSKAEALERIRAMLRAQTPHQIVTPAIEQVILARRDPEFRALLQAADLVVPDGMPLIFASRLSGSPLRERITGVDLMPDVCALAQQEGGRVFLLGGEPGVAEEAAQCLQHRIPGLQIAGTYCPPFGFENDLQAHQAAIDAVRAARPDVLLVALGCPKQEKWIHNNKDALGVPVMIGVGGAFNFITGREKRAPDWLQRLGLEGVYRLFQRPRDIWKRIMINAPYFVVLLADLLTYRYQKRLSRLMRPLFLGLGDIILAPLCFLFSYWLYFRSGLFGVQADPFPERSILDMPAYSDLLNFMAVLAVAALWQCRLYVRDKYLATTAIVWRSLQAAGLALFLVIAFQFLFKDIFFGGQFRGFSRMVFGLFAVTFFGVTVVWRLAFRAFEHALHRRGIQLDRIILVGNTGLSKQLAHAMLSTPELGNQPLGYVVAGRQPPAQDGPIPFLGTVDDLRRLLPARKIDEVVVADPHLPTEALGRVVTLCQKHRIALSMAPNLHEWLGVSSEIKQIGSVRVITVSPDAQVLNLQQSQESQPANPSTKQARHEGSGY